MRKLYLIRGVSGSGKSTLAVELAGRNQVAADDFTGLYVNGNYQFNKQKESHQWCLNQCWEMMENGLTPIAVHNTFCKLAYLEPYIRLAKRFGYTVTVIKTEGNYGTVHNVPKNVLLSQQSIFENYGVIDE